jgi:hypothetical protein
MTDRGGWARGGLVVVALGLASTGDQPYVLHILREVLREVDRLLGYRLETA